MSFETVERLKRDFTDKWVTVDAGTPELKRFVGLSGRIKTINMNGRALVQFDGPVDISWYDIDLAYLNVIAAPLPKKVAEKHAEPAEKKPAAAAKPAAPAAGKSPIEMARAQGAAGGAAVKKSPLELAREQGAAKAAGAVTAAAAAAPPAAGGDKPLSKLEQARASAAKAKAATDGAVAAPAAAPPPAAEDVPEPVAEAPAPAATPAPAAAAPVSLVGDDGKPLSKIELARRQGKFKG